MNKRIDNLMYKTSYNRDVNKKLDLQGDVERLQGEVEELSSDKKDLQRTVRDLRREKDEYLADKYKEQEDCTPLFEEVVEEIMQIREDLGNCDYKEGIDSLTKYHDLMLRINELSFTFKRVSIDISQFMSSKLHPLDYEFSRLVNTIDKLDKEAKESVEWQQKELRDTEEKYKEVIHQERETIWKGIIVGCILGGVVVGMIM